MKGKEKLFLLSHKSSELLAFLWQNRKNAFLFSDVDVVLLDVDVVVVAADLYDDVGFSLDLIIAGN